MGNQASKQCCTGDSRAKDADIRRKPMEDKPFNGEQTESFTNPTHGLESVRSSILQSPKIKEQYLSHENLFTRLVAHRQDHLLRHMEDLSPSELDHFYDMLYDIDFELMDMMYNHLILRPPTEELQEDRLEPVTNVLKLTDIDSSECAKLTKIGLDMIARGRLAIVLLSGGQGSRLGFEHAKGMYSVGMPSNKSLFNYFADRIKKITQIAQEKTGIKSPNGEGVIQFYLMTSEMNNNEIKGYFAENRFFGLDPNSIHFFCQQSLPSLDLNGKVILEDKNKIFLAPNGNGGCFTSLGKLNLVSQMKSRGVTHVQVFGVDNVLAKVADPYTLGYAEAKNYDVTCKYVAKRDPTEPAGVFVLRNGKPHVIEYSEIPKELSEMMHPNGKLVYDSANILNAFYKIDFLDNILSNKKKEIASQYHVAKKKIQYYDEKIKRPITPLQSNGYKFELFIHDCFQLCAPEKFGIIEAKREEEFAPVKNAPGSAEDSPDTARALISSLHQGWLKRYGVEFEDVTGSEKNKLCEIDTMHTYDGEGLEEIADSLKGHVIQLPLYIK